MSSSGLGGPPPPPPPQNFVFYHLVPTFLPKKVDFIVFTQFFGHFAQNVPTLVEP